MDIDQETEYALSEYLQSCFRHASMMPPEEAEEFIKKVESEIDQIKQTIRTQLENSY